MIFSRSRVFVLWVLLHITYEMQAQTPGYLNARTGISTAVWASPTLLYGLEENRWNLNTRAALRVERVLSRQFSLNAVAYGLQTRVRYAAGPQLLSGFARVSGWAGGLGARMYSFRQRGNIAPLGPFHQLELLYFDYSLRDIDGIYTNGGNPAMGRWKDWGFSYTWGYQYILFRNISWSAGMQAAVISRLFQSNFRATAPPQDLASARLARHLSLNLFAGIGWLF